MKMLEESFDNIVKLIDGTLNIGLIVRGCGGGPDYYGPDNYECPYCGNANETYSDIRVFPHETNCAYRIADKLKSSILKGIINE